MVCKTADIIKEMGYAIRSLAKSSETALEIITRPVQWPLTIKGPSPIT